MLVTNKKIDTCDFKICINQNLISKTDIVKHLGGPTKHRKDVQGTENSAKNCKALQGTTRYL